MEKKLQQAKAEMLKGELADFKFTPEMKENVLHSIRTPKRYSFKKIIPTLVSAALIILFFGGLYQYVIVPNSSWSNGTGETEHQSEVPVFEEYKGEPLKIALLGDVPILKEQQVTFTAIPFEDLSVEILKPYDAVFISEECLVKASEGPYTEVYTNAGIPIFFIGANSYIPFTEKGIEFDKETWGWKAGVSYTSGIMQPNGAGGFDTWEFGLYNDINNAEHIQEMFSRIFKAIQELKLQQKSIGVIEEQPPADNNVENETPADSGEQTPKDGNLEATPDKPIDIEEKPKPDQEQPAASDEIAAPDLMDLLMKFKEARNAHIETLGPGFKVPDAKTKRELYKKFGDYAVLEVLEREWDRFYAEKPDGLYLKPQDGPLYIVPTATYVEEKLTETSYKFTQVTDADMYGDNYKVEVWFEYMNGKWLIKDWKSGNN
ncbi:hypothetical protein [Bacillus sp. FJAT-18017]|uniref:hypothetical protein n=1 Tax=Bacillus sp. FJAT-18017 TaxID=1705566 RepID=UPI0006AEE1A4|nr:hypothetical protein [Bacillus sp. FJAT-18017]